MAQDAERPDVFLCSNCQREVRDTRTPEEVAEQMKSDGVDALPDSERAVVCRECYKLIMRVVGREAR